MFVEITPTSLKFDEKKVRMLSPATVEGVQGFHTAVIIPLSAGKEDDFAWEGAIELARKALLEEKKIIWELRFDEKELISRDSMYIPLMENAAAHFSEKVYPLFTDDTLAVIMGRLSWDWIEFSTLPFIDIDGFLEMFSHESLHTALKTAWGRFTYTYYAYMALAEDMARVSSQLPYEVPSLFILDSTDNISAIEEAYMCSPLHFEHVHLAYAARWGVPTVGYEKAGISLTLSNEPVTETLSPCVGVLVPKVTEIDLDFFNQFESFVRGIEGSYRYIPEERATELWDEIETLLYFPEYISQYGKRVLKGFVAAGGNVRETYLKHISIDS